MIFYFKQGKNNEDFITSNFINDLFRSFCDNKVI